jgi:hypothetical protein
MQTHQYHTKNFVEAQQDAGDAGFYDILYVTYLMVNTVRCKARSRVAGTIASQCNPSVVAVLPHRWMLWMLIP